MDTPYLTQPLCRLHLIALVCLATLAFSALAAPPSSLRFDNFLEEESGSSSVVSLMQDRQGFVWLGAENGLYRHNGYQPTPFRFNPRNPNSLPDDFVLALYEDGRGRIWVGTSRGLARFEAETGGFKLFVPDSAQDGELFVQKIISDGKTGMWLATRGGLQHFDPDSGRFRRYRHDASQPGSLADNILSALALDAKGGLWVATWPSGLDYLAPGASVFQHYRVDSAARPDVKLNSVRALLFDHRQRLWIGTESAIVVWRQNTDWTQRKRLAAPPGLDEFRVNTVYQDNQKNVWIGTLAAGLLLWDEDQRQFAVYQHRPEDKHSLPSNVVSALLRDRSGILWVGTSSDGISRVDLTSRGFERLIPRDLNPDTRHTSNYIISMAGDVDGRVWLGSSNGLSLFDPVARKLTQSFHHDPRQPGSLSNSLIYSLYQAPDGLLWVGTPSGLNRLDRKNGLWKQIRFDGQATNFISRITPGRGGILWLGTGGGVIRYDPKSGAVKRFSHDPANPDSRSIDSTSVILEDRAGRVWAGGWYAGNGLDVLDQATGKFTHYHYDPKNPVSLRGDRITALFEDEQGTLWVGTENGLYRVVPQLNGEPEFRPYVLDNAISNPIQSILSDGDGHLWISSSAGLYRLEPDSGKVTYYSATDGIITEGFNIGSSVRADNGKLYFGGAQGVTVVQPSEIRPGAVGSASLPPQVVMADISVFNRSLNDGARAEGVHLEGAVTDPKALTLSWRESVFSLEFAALSFADPRRNRYAYRLEGFDRNWVESDAAHRVATYTNLEPGKYVFRVKAANHKGIWNETGVVLPITITPPFWKTVWFQSIFALLLLGLGVAAYQLRIRALKRNQQHLETVVKDLVEERTTELLKLRDQALSTSKTKSEFLANMSHEIRTPMNAIIGMTQLALRNEHNPKQRNYLEKVDAAASGLLGIINDVLDFSKIEAGKLEFEQVDFSLGEVMEHLSSIAVTKAQGKGLKLLFDIGADVPKNLVGDALRLTQVLINLVDNAIKFTEKGEVVVGVQRVSDDGNRVCLRFEVADTGVGLSKEQQASLFNPFAQADTSTTRIFGGTGLGLSICKRLVEMMGGNIDVKSDIGSGSRFFFTAKFGVQSEQQEPHSVSGEMQEPSLRSPENAQDAEKALHGAYLLLVEDNAVNREFALEILGNAGIRADVAHDGSEAVEMVGRANYDGVLMDCLMPVMDGFDATREIRADGRFRDLPIIAMTANAMAGDREKCIGCGMNDHIAKPININRFFLTLAQWITPHSSHDDQENSADDQRQAEEYAVPRLAGIATDEAMACVNGNVALYRKILAALREDQADAVARIREACRSGDRKTAVMLAHTLKGLAGNVGAVELAKAVKALESALRAEQDDSVDILLESVHGLLNDLLVEIDRAMPQRLPCFTQIPSTA